MNWALVVLITSLADRGVIESIFVRQAELAERIKSVCYRADFSYLEFDSLTGRNRRLGCVRRVVMTSYEDQQDIFLSATVDGREVSGAAAVPVCRELKRKGLIARRSRLPFLVSTRGEYEYEIIGRAKVKGESCWAIKFFPKRADDRHLRGLGYVLTKGHDVVRLEFVPARLPFVVRAARMVLDYQPIQGFWLPCCFSMTMDLRLRVFKELLHQHLEIVDVYSDYRLRLKKHEP